MATAVEQGKRGAAFLETVKHTQRFTSEIITDEQRLSEIPKGPWRSFVTFPKEFKSISDSYISPEDFLMKGLDIESIDAEGAVKRIMGEGIGAFNEPMFQKLTKNFKIRVLNGSMNEHALKMSEMASHGFKFESPDDRAEYQSSLATLVQPMVVTTPEVKGIRIFDDCLASADSIYGYLYSRLEAPGGEDKMREGVRIDVAVATPQAIMLLKRFAEVKGFPLEINVSHLAYGLNEKNYITYPEELLSSGLIDEEKVAMIRSLDKVTGGLYVVGDMGNAQMGISQEDLDRIRKEKGESAYLWFNNTRTDPHGEHPLHGEHVLVSDIREADYFMDFVYFARGGYLPYHLDTVMQNPAYKYAKKLIYRGARQELEGQYGVAFKEE